jgi:hypothetical protein
MKRRSFLRNGLLVAVALVMLASTPLAVSADPVDGPDDDQDSDECHIPDEVLTGCVDEDAFDDQNPNPSERTGYTEPAYTWEWENGALISLFEPAKELAQVGAYDAIDELDPEHIPSAEVMEPWEGVDPSEVFDDQDDSDE